MGCHGGVTQQWPLRFSSPWVWPLYLSFPFLTSNIIYGSHVTLCLACATKLLMKDVNNLRNQAITSNLSSWNPKVQILSSSKVKSGKRFDDIVSFFVITFSVTNVGAVLWMPVRAQPLETLLTYGKPLSQNEIVLHINMHTFTTLIHMHRHSQSTEAPCLLTFLLMSLNGVAVSFSHKMLMSRRWTCVYVSVCVWGCSLSTC